MQKIDVLLQQFLDRIGQSDGAPYVGLFRGWRNIVGDRIADHAEPVDIRGSAIIIEADHPAWVQMVMMSRNRIIRQLNSRYPELTINGMHVRVAGDRAAAQDASGRGENARDGRPGSRSLPGRPADRTPEEIPAPPPPSADESEALEKIDDDGLRGSLERLRESLEVDSSDSPETDQD